MAIHSYFPGRGTLVEECLHTGEAKGRAKSVLELLAMRGVSVSPEIRRRILDCDDPFVMGAMFNQAFNVTEAEELFTLIDTFLQEGEAKGRAKERARQVLRVLAHREIPVSSEIQERIEGCSDLEILDQWGDRAFTVSRAEDLFESVA